MTATISEQDVQQRRAELQAERIQLERRRPGLAVRKESGDSAASDELAQVNAKLAELQQALAHHDLVAAGIAEQRARERQERIEAAAAAEAVRRRQLEVEHEAMLGERDALYRDVEQHLSALAGDMNAAESLAKRLDVVASQIGRSPVGGPHRVFMLRNICERARHRLNAGVLAVAPEAGPMFGPSYGTGQEPLAAADNKERTSK